MCFIWRSAICLSLEKKKLREERRNKEIISLTFQTWRNMHEQAAPWISSQITLLAVQELLCDFRLHSSDAGKITILAQSPSCCICLIYQKSRCWRFRNVNIWPRITLIGWSHFIKQTCQTLPNSSFSKVWMFISHHLLRPSWTFKDLVIGIFTIFKTMRTKTKDRLIEKLAA